MDKGKMISTPSQNFKTVQDLVDSKHLSKEEKITALLNWKSSCEHQEESTSEGMRGERTTPIAEVMAALRELED